VCYDHRTYKITQRLIMETVFKWLSIGCSIITIVGMSESNTLGLGSEFIVVPAIWLGGISGFLWWRERQISITATTSVDRVVRVVAMSVIVLMVVVWVYIFRLVRGICG
jgi:hypothetical protein